MSDKTEKYIMETLGRVEGNMKDGFDRIERRMDNFVTTDAHKADIQLVNMKTETLAKQVEAAGARTIRVVGWALTAAGIISGSIFGVLNILIK